MSSQSRNSASAHPCKPKQISDSGIAPVTPYRQPPVALSQNALHSNRFSRVAASRRAHPGATDSEVDGPARATKHIEEDLLLPENRPKGQPAILPLNRSRRGLGHSLPARRRLGGERRKCTSCAARSDLRQSPLAAPPTCRHPDRSSVPPARTALVAVASVLLPPTELAAMPCRAIAGASRPDARPRSHAGEGVASMFSRSSRRLGCFGSQPSTERV